jgi:hypothetical protein
MSEPVPVRSPPVAEFAMSTTISPRPTYYHPMMTMRSTFSRQINLEIELILVCRRESRSKARSNDAVIQQCPRRARYPRYEKR